jgi:uncharacterized protein
MAPFDFDSFSEKLKQTLQFPSVYMFKFIVQADNRKIALVESIFSAETELHRKTSSAGKYISITAKQVVMNADEIISVYRAASAIEGVMWL